MCRLVAKDLIAEDALVEDLKDKLAKDSCRETLVANSDEC